MVSFDTLKLGDGLPIYTQIILHIKREIVTGNIRDGDELPSRRVLSSLLGVNPNTVQKAYRLLEDEALIASHSGAKSYMVLNEETVRKVRTDLMENDARFIISAMKQMGISKQELLKLIEQIWEERIE